MCSQIGINSASVNVGFPDLADREESGYILIACLEFSGGRVPQGSFDRSSSGPKVKATEKEMHKSLEGP